jgi:hypothetical protein
MAAAASHRYHILKPWGDSLAYDVDIERADGLLRVQVKSSSVRNGTGYFCQFHRNYLTQHPYPLDDVDLFATYIIPVTTWYLIPAAVILTPTVKVGLTRYPVTARGTHCVAGVSEIKDFVAYTPTGSFFVASNCRSTYCRIPPFA